MPNRKTIAEVPSGKIELVFEDGTVQMQFNCSCADALPYCHAICCRHRPYFNILLDPDEITKFECVKVNNEDISIRNGQEASSNELYVLKEEGSQCIYLDGNTCHCKVHDDKPRACSKYHCSPGGIGENVSMRDGGWILLPKNGNAQGIEINESA